MKDISYRNIISKKCRPLDDLSGKTFNNLQVLGFSHIYKCCRFWHCKCLLCNSFCIKRGVSIKNGNVKSCGCLAKATHSKTGSKYGIGNMKTSRDFTLNAYGKNIKFRSSFETIYAEWLIRNNINFEYEPKIFNLGNGIKYIPDFYLPRTNEYIEVKGYYSKSSKEKVKKFIQAGNKITVIFEKQIMQMLDNISYKKYLNKFEKYKRE